MSLKSIILLLSLPAVFFLATIYQSAVSFPRLFDSVAHFLQIVVHTPYIKAIDLRKKKRKDGNVEGGKTKEIER